MGMRPLHGLSIAGSFLVCAFILATAAFAEDFEKHERVSPGVADTTSANDAASGVTDRLLSQGPIGIVCLILIGISARVWKDARDDRKEYKAEMERREREHAALTKEKDERLLTLSLEHAKDRATATILLERISRHLDRREREGG